MEKEAHEALALVERLRAGEHEAFRRLMQEYLMPLYRFARARSRSDDAAEELIQRAFVRIWQSRKRLPEPEGLRAWCYRVVLNLAKDRSRDERLRATREAQGAAMRNEPGSGGISNGDGDLHDEGLSVAMGKEAWALVAELSGDLREPLELHFAHGLSLAEVGEALSLSKATVHGRIQDALAQLRRKLEVRRGGIPAALGTSELATFLQRTAASAFPVVISSTQTLAMETAIMASIGSKTATVVATVVLALALMVGGGIWYAHRGNDAPVSGYSANGGATTTTTAAHANVTSTLTKTQKIEPVAATPVSPPLEKLPPSHTEHSSRQPTTTPDATHGASTTPATEPSPETAPTDTTLFEATVEGMVVDERMRGVAGARITAIDKSDTEVLSSGSVLPGATAKANPNPLFARSVTDETGRFRVRLALRRPVDDSSPMRFALMVEHSGYASSLSPIMWLPSGQTLTDIVIPLYPEASIEGRVVADEDPSRTLAGVKVQLFPAGSGEDERLANPVLRESHSGMSDSAGNFRITNLLPGRYVVAAFPQSGASIGESLSGTDTVEVEAGESKKELILKLKTAALVLTFDPPITGAIEVALRAQFKLDTEIRTCRLAPNNQGEIIIGPPPRGKVVLKVKAPGFQPLTTEVNINAPTDVTRIGPLKLEVGGRVLGTVVDSAGKPIAGEQVRALQLDTFEQKAWISTYNENGRLRVMRQGDDKREVGFTTTGSNGEFILSDLPSGKVEVVDGAPWSLYTTNVVVKPGEDITLAPLVGSRSATDDRTRYPVSGLVTVGEKTPTLSALGADGKSEGFDIIVFENSALKDKPLRSPNFSPFIYSYGNKYEGHVFDVTGRFGPCLLLPGQYTIFAGWHGQIISREVTVDDEPIDNVRLDFAKGGSVKGTISDAAAGPKAGLALKLTNETFASFASLSGPFTRTDHEGNYTFSHVPPGTYYVRLATDSDMMPPAQLAERTVTVSNDQSISFDLTLGTDDNVCGRVTLDGQGGIFKEAILLRPGDFTSLRGAVIDAQGEFAFSKVPAGSWYLWLTDNKFSPALFARTVVTIEEGKPVNLFMDFRTARISCDISVPVQDLDESQTVELVLRPAFEDNIGPDPAVYLAKTTRSAKFYDSGTLRVDGAAAFTCVAGVSYVLNVSYRELAPVEKRIDVTGDMHLDLQLGESGGVLDLQIASITGDDTAAARSATSQLSQLAMVTLTHANGTPVSLSQQDQFMQCSGGSTRRFSLAAGSYFIEVRGRNIETYHAQVDIEAGKTIEHRMDIFREATLRLKVMNTEIEPATLQGAKITVTDEDGSSVDLGGDILKAFGIDPETVAGHELIVAPLGPGRFLVTVNLEGYAPLKLEVQLARSCVEQREITFVHK